MKTFFSTSNEKYLSLCALAVGLILLGGCSSMGTQNTAVKPWDHPTVENSAPGYTQGSVAGVDQ